MNPGYVRQHAPVRISSANADKTFVTRSFNRVAARAVHLLPAGHYQRVRTRRPATATGPIETVIDEDLIDEYVGALHCSRAVLPFMESAGWRRIINLMGLCTYEATLYACAQDLQGRKLDEPQRRPPVGGSLEAHDVDQVYCVPGEVNDRAGPTRIICAIPSASLRSLKIPL